MLHATPYFAPAFCYGGPPKSILGLCRGLQRAGVEVEVFTTTANGSSELPASPPEGERYDGVPVRYFPRSFPRRLFGARGLAPTLASDRRPDLIHIHGLWNLPAWTAARHAWGMGIPYALSPRGMLNTGSLAHRSRRKRLAYWMIERRNLERATFLHATAQAEADTLQRRVGGATVVTLPNGVDLPPASALNRGTFRQRLGLSHNVPLIAFLGRVHPIKRLDLLAVAFDRVRANDNRVNLVIAGPDEGGHRRHVEPCFARSAAAVHWTGELAETEKWTLLTDSDVLVMCSNSESFGMSVVEAMAAGVPVVVTQTCPWEEIESVGCGFWVPHTAESIAEAVLRLLRDQETALVMGERGRRRSREVYSWEAIGRAMAGHYNEVVAARPSPVPLL